MIFTAHFPWVPEIDISCTFLRSRTHTHFNTSYITKATMKCYIANHR